MALNQDIWLASCSGSEPTRGLLVELSCFPRLTTSFGIGSTMRGRSWVMWRTVEASGPFRFPIEGPIMSDNSPRKSTGIETAFHAKKR